MVFWIWNSKDIGASDENTQQEFPKEFKAQSTENQNKVEPNITTLTKNLTKGKRNLFRRIKKMTKEKGITTIIKKSRLKKVIFETEKVNKLLSSD